MTADADAYAAAILDLNLVHGRHVRASWLCNLSPSTMMCVQMCHQKFRRLGLCESPPAMPPKRRRPKASARKAKKEKSIPNPFDQPPPAGQLSLMSFAPVSGEPLLSQPGEADASAARASNVAGPKPRRGRTPMKRPSSHNAEDVAPTSKARPRKRPAAAASAEDTKASQAASASNKSSSNSSSSDSVSTDSTSKTDAAYVARPAFSPRKLRLESATEHDGDAFAAPSTIPATVMTDCKDLAGLFGFARRNVNRITEDFDSNALHNLARNLDGCKLLSLYSDLGGAELSQLNCWSAVCEAMTSHGKPPEALACLCGRLRHRPLLPVSSDSAQ